MGEIEILAIMPTYNQAEFLEEALKSLCCQVECLVVVVDGSTDNTRDILGDWSDVVSIDICCHRLNLGTASAINTGWNELVRAGWIGEGRRIRWVTWASSDNLYRPNWGEAMREAIQGHPRAGAIYSGYFRDPPGVTFYQPHSPERLLGDVNCYYGPSFVIRSDVWERAGPHRGRISHDYDHWLRVEEMLGERELEIIGIPEPLVHYRVHPKRATVVRADQFDAPHWQTEARRRRGQA